MRLLLPRLLLFLLPFILYYVFLFFTRRLPARTLTPWTLLAIAGLALVAASFVYLGLTEGDSTRGAYVPAHVVDGRVVPGHVEKMP
ncbi:MAG TPA: DUF6111 family protein [Rhizomicrobium sp.]